MISLQAVLGTNIVSPDNLSELQKVEGWQSYRKTSLLQALRIEGPFEVVYEPGGTHVQCEDGYVGVDARGYPYQIAKDEFDAIYEEAGPDVSPLDALTNALVVARSSAALLPGTRETALVKTKLDEAWHWLLHHKEGELRFGGNRA